LQHQGRTQKETPLVQVLRERFHSLEWSKDRHKGRRILRWGGVVILHWVTGTGTG
jgi:hypothetical protein